MKTFNYVFLILIAMVFCNCNNNNDKSESVTVQFLKSEHDAGKDFFLLDVRTTPEFYQGRLSFADELISYDSLNFYLDKIPQDKEATIYLFCRSGRRSGIATQFLRSLGYKNAYNVSGGINAWSDAGFEIVSGN